MILTLLDGAATVPAYGEVLSAEPSVILDMLADETECPSVPCADEQSKKNGSGFVAAEYVDNAASKALTHLKKESSTKIFVYDIDNMSVEEIEEAFPLWIVVSGVLYSTFKHRYGAPRYRLLVELDEPVPNYSKEPFTSLYLGLAAQLKIKADPKTLDRARFFFGPQHHPDHADERERFRFQGPPVKVSDIKKVSAKVERELSGTFEVAGDRPGRPELKELARRWRRSGSQRMKSLGSALSAILRKEAYAPLGSIHNTSMELAFELVREFRNLDTEWFAVAWLADPWANMGTAGFDSKLKDWTDSVESAKAKHAEREAEKQAEKEELSDALNAEEKTRAEAMRGRLVMSYRNAYFIYSPKLDRYRGPFNAAEVAVVMRDEFAGMDSIQEYEMTRSGPALKSATKLAHEYGGVADGAIFFPSHPPTAWEAESNSVCLQAYQWIDWEPVRHDIADDLLRTISGRHYGQLEAYLSKFRDLSQPLPALTLVGPKGCWKSRICSLLSRFWTSRHAEMPGKASKIMTRFNEHLVVNPVVWSDEQLAFSQYGKPQPEEYRESITAKTQTIEFKRVSGLLILKSAVRHMIAVNNDEKIFSSEVDADSIHATMERFLLMYTNMSDVEAFEDRWRDTAEMDRLRQGDSLLEHVRWLEENTSHKSVGRLFIQPHTDAHILLRARFADELLTYIWQVAIEALMKENGMIKGSSKNRLPIRIVNDTMYFSASRVQDLWSSSKATAGSMVRKPTVRRINTIMEKASFKAINGKRSNNAWEVNTDTFSDFLKISEIVDYDEFWSKCALIFGAE